jgi:hypothetical protein
MPRKIRTLFAIYLYGDEMFIHKISHFLIFKTLMFHHMAPMAGSIPNTDNNQFIFRAGFLQGFFTPWIPIHRIMSMLQQVRTTLRSKMIGQMLIHELFH